MKEANRDKQRGAMLGLAIGDALGAAVEFKPPGSFPPVTGYRGGGPHPIKPGMWTDDTSMALALMDSITQRGWDLADQLDRYCLWRGQGHYSPTGVCFDIGGTTSGALGRWRRGDVEPAQCGGTAEWSQGNGSIMRIAPVAIAYGPDEERAGLSSMTTHAHPVCADACRVFVWMLGKLMDDWTFERVINAAKARADAFQVAHTRPVHDVVVEQSFKVESGGGSGWVIDSLKGALWAVNSSDNFKEAVLKAVNLGRDADTTGAVTGQLAGARWGETGISQELKDGLYDYEGIANAVDALIDRSKS